MYANGSQAGLSCQTAAVWHLSADLHKPMSAAAPESGLMLKSGRHVLFCVVC